MIAFWSPKQSKIEESSIESMAKQLEAHLYEEPKLWSFIVLCQKQIMNARRENKERNLTWRIQEDSNCWTHLEHFLNSISCILYVISNLKKSGVQRFKRCTNRSWNEEVIAIGSQSHQAENWFLELHFMHTICRFKAREVRSPTIQMVHESEIKWRSYSHWKPIAPSWKLILQLRKHKVLAAKFRNPSCMPAKSTWVLLDICDRLF